jgi:hypothetical protein
VAAIAVVELLMMGGRTTETSWAVNKRQDNKLEKLLHLVFDLFELLYWYFHRTLKLPVFAFKLFNLLKPTCHVMQQQVKHSTTVRSAHTVFLCFVFILEQTAICATYSINW